MTRLLAAIALAIPLFAAPPARAQDAAASAPAAEAPPPTGTQPSPNTNPLSNPAALFGPQGLGASFGAGKLDGDWYVQATGTLDLDLGKIGLGFWLPLNLLVYSANEPPTRAEKTYGGVIRKADWPAPDAHNYGKYLALVRYARFGQKRDPVYAYYGQMFGATVGHGTILNRYNNSLDLEHPRRGAAVDLNFDWGGLETFANDIAWPATNLVGTRAHVRPFGFGKTPILRRWALGASLFSDRNAPLELARAPTATGEQAYVLGEDGRPASRTGTSKIIVGLDTEFEVLSNDIISLIPYADYNVQLETASGIHLGALATFRFPVLGALKVWSRLEYRIMEPGYLPDYFDTLYDQQRYFYPVYGNGGAGLVPKAAVGALLKTDDHWKHSIYGEATADVLGMFSVGATLTGTPGLAFSKTAMLFATLPKFDTVKVSAYYLRKDFDAWEDIVTLDERSMATAVILFKIFGPLYVTASVTRAWRTQPDGNVASTDDFNFGLQTYVTL